MSYDTACLNGRADSMPQADALLRPERCFTAVRDPGSALTHFIAMAGTLAGAFPLLKRAASDGGGVRTGALLIFIASMFLLYTASTAYHTFDISPDVNRLLKKIDHMMISVLIAGSYTPVCLVVLGGDTGLRLLILVWGIALAGIVMNIFWIGCPKWVSSAVYIAMGWCCLTAFGQILEALPRAAFLWLLAGGLIYTAGGVIYALKLKRFNSAHRYFGSHEIFHLFVMGGSLCHYVMMYRFVA